MTVPLLTACGRGVVASLAVLSLATACTSTTTGSGSHTGAPKQGPAAPATTGGGGGFGASGGPSAGGGSGGGGGANPLSGNFCHDWSVVPQKFSPAGLGGVRQNLIVHWDQLAAEAPAPIKADVLTLDQYLHSVVSGTPDPSMIEHVGPAVRRVVVWVAQNCH